MAALIILAAVHAEEFDTEHLYAFHIGTDTENPGEKEIQASLAGGFGRNGGSYSALEGELAFQYTPVQNILIELSAATDYHDIGNVPGIDNLNRAAFGGLGFSLTYRLVDRAAGGFGLALYAAPHWSRVDDETGEPINGYASTFLITAEKEIVRDRLLGVVNLLYEPEIDQSRIDEDWSRQSTAGLGGGLMLRLSANVFAGMEARYLRRYDALDLTAFAGQAFYLGPTISIAFNENAWLTAGWIMQVAGRAAGDNGALDLENFDRHQARIAFGISF